MRTYTLNGSIQGVREPRSNNTPPSGVSDDWGYWGLNSKNEIGINVESSSSAYFYAVTILFDATTLAHIVNQNASSIVLELTSTENFVNPSYSRRLYVGTKKYNRNTQPNAAATNDDEIELDYIGNGKTFSAELSQLDVPLYGYTVGQHGSNYGSPYLRVGKENYGIIATAVLTIVTDEEQRTLSYNANGGSGAPSAQTVWGDSYSSETTVSTTTPTRTGYSFTGWNTSQDGSGTPYAAGDSITIYENTTLYAQWSALKSVISSVGDGDTGSTITVQWTAQGNFAHTLSFSFGSASVTGVQVAAGTNQYRFTIPTSWNAQLPTTTSGTATVTLTTIADGTNIGTDSDTFTVSVPASVVPSIGSLTAAKVNNNPTVAAWDIYLQSHSQVELTASSLVAGDGATIASVRFTGDNCDVTNYTSSASTTATSNVIESYGPLTYTALVTDSRGRTATRTVTINVTQYSKPTVTFFYGWRCDADGTTNPVTGESLSAQVRYSYTNINGNTITNTLSYKKTTESSYTTAFTDVATGAYKVFAIDSADMASTYDLQFTVTDTLMNTTTVYAKVSSVVGIAFGLKNDRARFGGACRQSGLEIDWQTQIDNRLSIKTDNAYPFRVFNANGDKALDMINYNGTAMFSMYDAGVERNYIGQGRFSTYDSAGNEVDRVSQGGSFFGSDVTFNGVLDVTQRRCYATLSSAGWYRVCTTRDIAGTIIEFNIGRPYGANPAEAHRVLFYVVGGGKSSFIDETSISNTLGIDKIRCTYGGGLMHFDVHYSLSTINEVLVYFDVCGKGEQNGSTVSNGLQAVADAPSGESTAAEHQFYVSNKPINVQETSSLLASGTIQAVGNFSYEASEPCWVYLMFVMQANSSGSINIKVDNVDIVNWTSGEAIPVNFAFIPIPLMRGNTLYVAQSSNRASTYKIFAMR